MQVIVTESSGKFTSMLYFTIRCFFFLIFLIILFKQQPTSLATTCAGLLRNSVYKAKESLFVSKSHFSTKEILVRSEAVSFR